MFIVWGWRVLRYVLGTGTFFCPQCDGDSEYQHLRLRRWGTLFFLPIIPMSELGTHVECTRCRSTFTEAVLALPTAELFQYHLGLANRATVANLAALARPMSPVVESMALRALESAPGVGPGYDRAAFHVDVRVFAGTDAAASYLRPLASQMTIEGREAVLRRLASLAAELPGRSAETDAAVESFARELLISPAHLLGVRQSLALGTTPGGSL